VYYNECKLSINEKEKFKEYLKLIGDYKILKKNERSNRETLYKMECKIASLTEDLKEHPYFASLTTFIIYNIDQVQDKIIEDEGIIQFIFLDELSI
jgi:hypothetical protein